MSRRHRGRNFSEEDLLEVETTDRRRRVPPAVAEMERIRDRRPSPPPFLRRSSSAGPMVVRPRQREEYEYLPREPDHYHEHEEIHIPGLRRRRSPSDEWDRDRAYLRRERSRPPRGIAGDDEIITRKVRDYHLDDIPVHRRKHRDYDTDWEMEREREITRNRRAEDISYRRMSHERERARPQADEMDELIISREHRDRGRRRDAEREEIIIRHEAERSPSPEPSIAEPGPVRAPPIHQDVITHHKHVQHGYETVPEVSRKPADLDDIEFRRRRERNLRDYDRTDIEISHRRESPPPRHEDEIHISHRSGRKTSDGDRPREVMVVRDRDTKRNSLTSDIRDEAAYYNRIATEGAPMGEAYNGHTRDWNIVDVPPGTKRVTMDGVGGASQEISWQRYNGVRRSKFHPSSDDYESEPQPTSSQGNVARRYVGVKDKRDELWTEITKDLVVKEAIEKAGFEYEETEHFYYVFAYLRYEDVSSLVRLSEEFRRSRRDRIREIQRERAMLDPPPRHMLPPPEPPATVYIDRSSSRALEHDRSLYEREVITDEIRRPSRLSYSIER